MKIAIKRQDGGVSIMHIINGTPEGEIAKSRGLTNEWVEIKDEEFLNRDNRDEWTFEDIKQNELKE